MRIAIMGAGGMGGFLGAKLLKAGYDVAFIARGAHLEALRENGLALLSEEGDIHVAPVTASDDPGAIGPVDMIIFSVKLFDTEQAAAACLPLMQDKTFLLTLQNGVESVEMISRIIGPGRTLAGSIYVSASIAEPGVIRHNGGANMLMYAGPEDFPEENYKPVADMVAAAGLTGDRHPDMRVMLWEKFVLLAANAGLGTLTGRDAGALCRDPDSRPLFRQALQEVVAVARADGVTLSDGLVDMIMARIDGLKGQNLMASQAVAKARGQRLELEWIQGTLHRLGRKYSIPTPLHSLCYVCLKPYADSAPDRG
tara:strand:- start:6143 stop:7075 length:933 start_codon:yes stop_codon:yes gene_type:complete